MFSDQFLWGNEFLWGELLNDAKNSDFKIFESALYMKCGSMPSSLESQYKTVTIQYTSECQWVPLKKFWNLCINLGVQKFWIQKKFLKQALLWSSLDWRKLQITFLKLYLRKMVIPLTRAHRDHCTRYACVANMFLLHLLCVQLRTCSSIFISVNNVNRLANLAMIILQ